MPDQLTKLCQKHSLLGPSPTLTKPSHVILAMKLAIVMILIVALLAFLVSMKYYPLGAQRVAEMRKMLKRLQEEETGDED